MPFKKNHVPWNKGRTNCFSEDTKGKMSKAKKGKTPWNKGRKTGQTPWNKGRQDVYSKQTLEKMSKGRSGGSSWNKGRKWPEEIIGKMKESHKNVSDETRKRISESNKGRTVWNKGRKETRSWVIQKQSKSHLGQISWLKGKKNPYTEKMLERMRENRLKQVFPKKDTKPERIVQQALFLRGIKFEKHKPILGQPDIFIKPNWCIFVDGDYFHAHPDSCPPDKIIKSKGKMRIAKDVWEKDNRINKNLEKKGCKVIRIWESDISHDITKVAKNLLELIENERDSKSFTKHVAAIPYENTYHSYNNKCLICKKFEN